MQFHLNQEEIQALLYAIGTYKAHLQEEAEELAEFGRAKKAQYFFGVKEEVPYYRSEIFFNKLRDKLKQFQMQFPLEEHKCQYNYEYEGCKWDKNEIEIATAHLELLLQNVDKSIWRNIV
jgi:hypothetical protein